MTQPELTMTDFEQRAQQAIADFDVAEGLKLSVKAHEGGAGYVELSGHAEGPEGEQGFAYRATHADLTAHGDAWFLRRAMRSLNDQFVAGHLPLAGEEAPHQVLRPPSEYRLPEADLEVNGPQSEDTLASLDADS